MAYADVIVRHQCAIVILEPITKSAMEWLEQNIGRDKGTHPHWPTVSLGPSYAAQVVSSMESHGLVVKI